MRRALIAAVLAGMLAVGCARVPSVNPDRSNPPRIPPPMTVDPDRMPPRIPVPTATPR